MIHDKIRAGILGLITGGVFMLIWTFAMIVSNEVHELGLHRSDLALRFVVLAMSIAIGVLGKVCHDQHRRLKKLEEWALSKRMEPLP